MKEDISIKHNTSYYASDISTKEEDGEFYSEGYIATTHPDRSADREVGVVGDILSDNVLKQITEFINKSVATIQGIGSTRTVSKQHDWVMMGDPDMEPAGMAMPPAEIRTMEDGHRGVFVRTHHNKQHVDFDEIKYNVKFGYYPGYSIEYVPGDYSIVEKGGQKFRFLKSIVNFVGYAFASARKIANPMATITSTEYKEIAEEANAIGEINTEVNTMTDSPEIKEEVIAEPKVEEVSEPIPEAAEEPKEEPAEEEKEEEASEPEEEAEPESKEVEQASVKEVAEKIVESPAFKEAVSKVEVENKIKISEEGTMENVSIKQMNEAISAGLQIKENLVKYNDAADLLFYESKAVKEALDDVARYGKRELTSNLKVKAMGSGIKITSNIAVKDALVVGDNTSSYTQDDVELADVFAAGIIDGFNNQTNFFGFIGKEMHPDGAGAYYDWKMITDKDPLTTSTFVAQDATAITTNYSEKGNYRTPLKIARRGVSVSDFINRYSAKSLGDLFKLELDLQMKEMMNDVDAALFAEVADGTGVAPLGLEAVADSVGNTTLYGLTRSTANRLAPDTAADTYEAIGGDLTEGKLRSKITYLRNEGSKVEDLAIIASPNTYSYLLNLLDGNRRFITVSAQFGFNQKEVAAFDSIPIIVDHNCGSDQLYVIDKSLDVCALVLGMEPRIINLAKVAASVEAYVQMDFAFVYKQPRKIAMLDTLSGPAA